jgi:hypothetical protein
MEDYDPSKKCDEEEDERIMFYWCLFLFLFCDTLFLFIFILFIFISHLFIYAIKKR